MQGDAPLRYLSSADVESALPPLDRQLELAAEALGALGRNEAEMPSKVGVHPRRDAFLHAMPAWLRTRDLVGIKWVSAYPENAAHGMPSIQALIVLNDPDTGAPTCVMDGTRVTAARTAAVSGVAMGLFARVAAREAAVIGAGVQARSHVSMLGAVLPGIALRIQDPVAERAASLASWAGMQPGVAHARSVATPREAIAGSDVVVTCAAMGPTRQVMELNWLAPEALVVAIDFATYVSAEVARAAADFVVDDRAQFLAYRQAGYFDAYPDPRETLGEAIERGARREERPAGLIVTTALGVGLADVMFAEAVRATAERAGAGMLLPR